MAGRSSISADDPFEAYLRPPPNETPTERESRLKGEREALRISQEIDEVLKAERIAAKKSVCQLDALFFRVSLICVPASAPTKSSVFC